MNKFTIKLLVAFFLFSALFLSNNFQVNAESSDKPLFVIVSTNWCYACKILHPVIDELEAQYAGQVTFLHLDASDEAAVNASRQVAAQYGLAGYFDANRNVFPKVGILCPGSVIPDNVIIGASPKQTYIDAINTFILNTSKICSINGRPIEAINGPDRPDEPEIPEVAGGRPDIPILSERPEEAVSSGRPKELSFWNVGQPIPTYAYYQYLILPKCSSGNNVVCSNNVSVGLQNINDSSQPVFKPYNPNATRDEKGWHLKK